ncbi:MAG: hypothetical protein M3Y59_07835 [Myxococcota bacterium]|nr:hypothetical protein [Myxococcota bacterium]
MRRSIGLLLLGLLVAPLALADEVKAEAKAKLTSIEARLDAWDVEGAAVDAQALAQLVPEGLEALLYYQGRIAFEEGRYPDAIDLLQRAGVEDKPDSYLRLAKETQKIVADYDRLESQHFIFLFPKGKDAVLAPYALETLEKIRASMEQDLGYAPPGKVRVEVVGNARELAKVSTLTAEQIRKTGTIAICKFNKLMITSPKAVVRGYDWQDTLAHEYIHLVVSRKSANTVPIWLHEGLAKYLESRWRGEAGLALGPSQLALLGHRVKQDKLIPFEKMHPSIALLPNAEDAATAFAEVFFAIDLIFKQHGRDGLQTIIDSLRAGKTDKASVELATRKSFPAFEKAWLSHVKKQPFPTELLPLLEDKVTLKEDVPGAARKEKAKGREISFGEFAIVTETEARKFAHLGEVMRERNRAKAAALEFGKAHRIVGDKYQSVSDKYALSLLEIGEVKRAEQVLLGSLRIHPGIAATQVHLARIYLARKEWEKARGALMDALASDPFDPEIHISLVAVDQALNRPAGAALARTHSAILTGLEEKQIDALVKRVVARSDQKLGTSGVDTEPEQPAASGRAQTGEPLDAGSLP